MKMSIPSSYRTRSYPTSSFPKRFPYSLADLSPHDNAPATEFYVYSRMVNHIDENAVAELNKFYGDILPQPEASGSGKTHLPKTLDLCSSWISHIPLKSGNTFPRNHVVGVGLNAKELQANPILAHWKVLDLDAQPDFNDSLADADKGEAFEAVQQITDQAQVTAQRPFDAVICNVSIDYLTRPLDVLYHTANVVKPGGWVYLAISNRCFPTKVCDRLTFRFVVLDLTEFTSNPTGRTTMA
jgi:SAM-dependent methyltransferase